MKTRQEEAQANIDAFKALWKRMLENARRAGPEQRAAWRRKVDLPGSGTLTREEYLRQCGERARGEDVEPVAVRPVLREAGFGDIHIDPVERGNGAVELWPAVAVARAWLEQPRAHGEPLAFPSLVLAGLAGTGKTLAAAAAAALWAQRATGPRATGQGRPVVLVRVTSLSGLPSWELPEVLGEATRCRFLVLDDLGAEVPSTALRSALFDVLDARWMARRRTVLSANLSPEALHARLDWEGRAPPNDQVGRCWRRLAEGWVAQVSRSKGLLHVAGELSPFPAFARPQRRQGGEP